MKALPASMTACTGCREAIAWEGPRKDGACTGRCRCGEWFASAGLLRAEERSARARTSSEPFWSLPFGEPSAA